MSTFFGLLQRSKCCRCALGTSYKAKAQPSGLGLRLYLYLLIGRHYKILAINILGWGLKRISIHPWLIIYLVFRAIFQSIKWLVYHFLHDVSADVLSSIYNSTSLLLDNMMTSVNWLVLLKIITLLFFFNNVLAHLLLRRQPTMLVSALLFSPSLPIWSLRCQHSLRKFMYFPPFQCRYFKISFMRKIHEFPPFGWYKISMIRKIHGFRQTGV